MTVRIIAQNHAKTAKRDIALIVEAAATTGWFEKEFRRLFTGSTGLSPVRYRRQFKGIAP